MEIYFVIVNGQQFKKVQDTGEPQPIIFYSREEGEKFISDNSIDNAVVMSSIQWRDELQHRIAMMNKM